jgi:hypothetical protein
LAYVTAHEHDGRQPNTRSSHELELVAPGKPGKGESESRKPFIGTRQAEEACTAKPSQQPEASLARVRQQCGREA